jgi:ferredoxin-NADP reductase
MLERLKAGLNRQLLTRIDRSWIDYVVSNTMTEFNRSWNGLLWTYELKAQVLRVDDDASGVKTFTLLPNQHWKHMRAGQHIEVTMEQQGQQHRRHYSLASAQNGAVSITVKRVEGGVVSNWLHDHLKPGMPLTIGHARGQFTLDSPAPVLFICAGSGITPCHALMTDLLQGQRPIDAVFHAQFARKDEVIFERSLRAWQEQGSAVTIGLSRPGTGDVESGRFTPRLNEANFAQMFPDFMSRDIYLCGPQGFMEEVTAILKRQGYDMGRLHTERFTAHRGTGARANFSPTDAEIYFQHLDTRITLSEADRGLSLLQIAENHGLHLETGCRQGMCGTCKLTLKEGQVTGNTLGTAVYLCTAFPASCEVVLDA